MASEIATPAKDAAATETEVVSVDLPAPAGWKKKFTPKKGGTPKRNEISFISPTGEEITSKRQLEQYLRAHPGGPPSSEFDWGTGDTPRRSARLSANAKAKATETPEGEKPMKRERKSSGKKETKGKKDSEDGETVAPEEAKEPADVEMKDAEGNVDKVNEDAGAEAEEEAQKELAEKINENIEEKMEGKQENESSEKVNQTEPVAPVVEEEKEADKANKEKDDSEMLPPSSEGKKDENAEENKTEGSDMLPPTSEGKENVNTEKEKPEDSAGLPQTFELPKEETFELPKEEAPAEKESKDGDALVENDSFEENQEAAVPKEAQHPVNCDDGQHQPRASPVNC